MIISDERERLVHAVSLSTRTRATIGREGGGPLEFRTPHRVYATGHGAYALADTGNRKMLLVDSADVIVASYAYPEPIWAALFGGVNNDGHLYFERFVGVDRATQRPVDSVTVYRWLPATGAIEPVLQLDAPDKAMHVVTRTVGGGTGTSRFLFQEPFSVGDEWAVLTGDRIAVWREQRDALELFDLDGQPISPPLAVAFPPVRVTEADHDLAAPTGTDVTWTFPEYKPIVTDGSGLASPDGYFWLRLHGPARADTARYVVFSTSGQLAGVASAPSDQTLVGLGRGAAYFSEKDDLDLITVVRWQVAYP